MKHLIMLILHIAAALVFWPGLFLTIPLHLILSAVDSKNKPTKPANTSPHWYDHM